MASSVPTSITIRFIRPADAFKSRGRNDDVIRIHRVGADLYNVAFQTGNCDEPTESVMGDTGVWRWLRATIGLLEHDGDPFKCIQLDLPLMPSVLVRVSELSDAYQYILNAVAVHLDNWPGALQRTIAATAEEEDDSEMDGQDEEEDETEVLSTDSEAEYADMPPLIPAAAAAAPRYFSASPNATWIPRGRHHLFLDTNEEAD
jgi:hypothetical protein